MFFYKQTIGKAGENAAVKYLRKKHYKILEKNYANAIGETDIIARKDDFFIFIEVKTRTSIDFGYPSEAVNFRKQKKMILMAQMYLKNVYNTNVRFDVIEVFLEKETYAVKNINHITNAFGA